MKGKMGNLLLLLRLLLFPLPLLLFFQFPFPLHLFLHNQSNNDSVTLLHIYKLPKYCHDSNIDTSKIFCTIYDVLLHY